MKGLCSLMLFSAGLAGSSALDRAITAFITAFQPHHAPTRLGTLEALLPRAAQAAAPVAWAQGLPSHNPPIDSNHFSWTSLPLTRPWNHAKHRHLVISEKLGNTPTEESTSSFPKIEYNCRSCRGQLEGPPSFPASSGAAWGRVSSSTTGRLSASDKRPTREGASRERVGDSFVCALIESRVVRSWFRMGVPCSSASPRCI
ncbi:hypothetical protein EV126DRAFT_413890 [Verticillium dahliae]|nr:hypothetical protein EV126DRAFT_413890 [Verticillium dahliae]